MDSGTRQSFIDLVAYPLVRPSLFKGQFQLINIERVGLNSEGQKIKLNNINIERGLPRRRRFHRDGKVVGNVSIHCYQNVILLLTLLSGCY